MKAFLTVGTQLSFDRLVRAMDGWAGCNPSVEVFAQIGPTRYRPTHMAFKAFIGAGECKAHIEQADFVVAHAGMGSIISALEAMKPIIVMPRRASLGEHRNEHQLATVAKLKSLPRVHAIASEEEMPSAIGQVLEQIESRRTANVVSEMVGASSRLLSLLRTFVAAPAVTGSLDPSGDPVFEQLAGTVPGQFAGALQRR